ncbi:MAG: hypothetical protein LAO06_04270 [Acidobacteriia bacterium]|nr:hypothetical protein [Terriglobia bacterium]
MPPIGKTQRLHVSMRMRLIAFTIFLLGVELFGGEGITKDRTPVKLVADSIRTLTMPPFSMRGVQCDDSGNLYFASGFHPRRGVVLKLSTTGSTVLYKVTDADIEDPLLEDFQVTAERKVWMLAASGKKNKPYVIQFNADDPASANTIRLKVPEGLKATSIRSFGILANDKIVVSGYVDASAPKRERNREYLAVFDDTGKLIRESFQEVSKDVWKHLFGMATAAREGGVTYLLQLDKILVVSPTGEVSRTIPLTPPAPGFRPVLIKVNRRRLAIEFVKPKGDDPLGGELDAVFAVLDATTGEVLRVYEPTSEVGPPLACFSDEGFTFVHFNFDRKPPYLSLVTTAVK